MVFQKSTLYPHLSVRRNIGFGLELRQKPNPLAGLISRWLRPAVYEQMKRQQNELISRIQGTARLLGLEDVLDRRPSQLSGGQQQRVALGRAIARQPDVFLLDEPLSQLDGQLRAELRHELHLLQRRLHKTMIYVTHDQAEAMTLADRLVVMDRGAVQQADRPQVVYQQPCNRFVAGFLGWPAMNFIDGKLIEYGGEILFEGSGLSLRVPRAKNWVGHLGRAVTLGLRPEDVQPGCGNGPLGMEVMLVESLGSESLATMERNGLRMTAKVSGRLEIQNRQTVEVCFHMERALLFDRESGLALNSGRPAG
jgi:multiple sugar transport system ATP-binding protein